MKVPSHHSREQVSMADSTNMTRGLLTPNATVDKSKKMLSPGTRKKFGGGTRTFNVPLIELVQRAPQGYKVPYIVKKICTYIEHHGLDHEGVFRVNGSQRVVEKLRASFDHHGDANLEEDHDIMAVAGLLKLFLRELPESCIPEYLTKRFVTVQEENQRNAKECVSQLKVLLKELPEEHFDLLKHVVRFLVIVSCNEAENKMSPMALAIVFGPNLFRCGKGFVALKDQGSTNQIVYRFIVEYNSLFKEASEDPPAVYWERKKHNLVPPRPPPPHFAPEETMEVSSKPTPVPRKSKLKGHDGFHVPEIEEPDHSESSISSKGRYSHSYSSPNFSDDEMTGRLSPFHLDSDSGFSLVESPVPSARTSEFVDKAIKATVIGHLFGDESSLLNASIDTTIREDQTEPATDIHVVLNSNHGNQNDLNSTPVNAGVKDRMKMFETSNNQDNEALTKPAKQRPRSKAFEMFENKGIIITQKEEINVLHEKTNIVRLPPAWIQMSLRICAVSTGSLLLAWIHTKSFYNIYKMPNLGNREEDVNHDEVEDEEELIQEQEGFEKIRRTSDPLQNFKKPAGPPNRRSPSRKLRKNSMDTDEEVMDQLEDHELIPNGTIKQNGMIDVPKPREHRTDVDVNQNDARARIAFLDIRQDASNKANASPDKSPLLGAKPFVPPLDFSTLHENVGGQAPIPAQKAQSVSYQRTAIYPNMPGEEEKDNENEAPSPHSSKIKRKAGTTMDDEDLPPFSQVEQDQYKMHSHGSTDDEITAKMKSQMRKIQGLKKKIRQFEEAFEMEHGYKPSHGEKAAKPEIKKFMMELSRTRKEAKKLKEEAEMGSRSRHGSGASSTGERTDPPDLPFTDPSMSQTLDVILKKLKEKRKESQRPEDIELMKHEQVQDEKLAVQKALLHFEGIHGRPKSRDEKDLMRPLYDRYRTIKRLLSRQPMSPRGNLELQPVPEDKPIDIHSKFDDEHMFSENRPAMSIRVPTAVMENEEDDEHGAPLGTMEFAVTRDFSILKQRPLSVDDQGPHSPKSRRKLEMREDIENRNTTQSNLHELAVPELQDELIRSRNTKKRLRKMLRDFEEAFHRKTGRKVIRDDRIPMQTEYNEYKQIKARLKLLEALLSKHHHSDL